MTVKTKIHYEGRLKKNITRTPYGMKTVYKKGTVLYDCSEKKFEKLTKQNIDNETDLGICEGHGVYEYFDLNDIEFFKIETITTKKEVSVTLKDK